MKTVTSRVSLCSSSTYSLRSENRLSGLILANKQRQTMSSYAFIDVLLLDGWMERGVDGKIEGWRGDWMVEEWILDGIKG